MIKDQNCIKCGTKIKLGKFAYNQEVCFECFTKDLIKIKEQVTDEEHKDMLDVMMAVVAEVYGYDWRPKKKEELE